MPVTRPKLTVVLSEGKPHYLPIQPGGREAAA
jgi:hypothetical protein